MTKFLTLKHWQLFGLFLGLPILLQFIFTVIAIGLIEEASIFHVLPFMIILFFLGTICVWYYTLGTSLSQKLPPTVTMSLTWFKILVFIPVLMILLAAIAAYVSFFSLNSGDEPFFSSSIVYGLSLVFNSLISISISHSIYFLAKVLKSVEWQKPVIFRDYLGELFLIFFLPIGIWFLQPRVNKLFDPRLKLE